MAGAEICFASDPFHSRRPSITCGAESACAVPRTKRLVWRRADACVCPSVGVANLDAYPANAHAKEHGEMMPDSLAYDNHMST